MKSTLFFWIPCGVYRRDYVEGVYDTVNFIEIEHGKAIELGDSEPTNIISMNQRSTWSASSSPSSRLSFSLADFMRSASYS